MTTAHHHHGKDELRKLCSERYCPRCSHPLLCGGSVQTSRVCTVVAVCKACAFVEDFFLHGRRGIWNTRTMK